MSPAANLFRGGAFVATLLLVRYTTRTEGSRRGALFVGYLVAFSCVRERLVWLISRENGDSLPYRPAPGLGQIGAVNVVVAAGWVFTILVSFALARMIQRRNFPGTNLFLSLGLTALVTTAVAYAVEVTGMRLPLWRWSHPHLVSWLPLSFPADAFEGWATTAFVVMLTYAAFRYRLFGATRARSLWVTAAVLAVFWLSVLAQHWIRRDPPQQIVMIAYVAASTLLGFFAPPDWLGSSDRALYPGDGS